MNKIKKMSVKNIIYAYNTMVFSATTLFQQLSRRHTTVFLVYVMNDKSMS